MKKAHITAELSGWTSVAWDSWEDDEDPDFGDTTGPDGFCVSATKVFTLDVPDDATIESLKNDPEFFERVNDEACGMFDPGSLNVLDSEYGVDKDDWEITHLEDKDFTNEILEEQRRRIHNPK